MKIRFKKQQIWKPRLFRLGLYLTLLVILADWLQLLGPFENILNDRRDRYCQRFTPPPTDRIVHIDIDDDSLNEVGQWPWHRQLLAQVIDEISMGKPKVIGLDIYFPDPEQDEGKEGPNGSVELIKHDDILAASIKRAGNVLLPISVQFKALQKPDPMFLRVEQILEKNLELEFVDVLAELSQQNLNGAEVSQEVQRVLPAARKQAVLTKLESETRDGPRDLTDLKKALVPKSTATDVRSDAAQLLEFLYPKVMAIRATRRFRIPLPKDVHLAEAPGEIAVNISKFAEASRYSGFVDLPPSDKDGAVRTVPLLVDYRGTAFPHMALAMACALLDVDPRAIQCTRGKIILPIPNGNPIEIPAREERSTTLGTVGALVDVPFFGRPGADGWLTMYDFPRYQEPVAHIKIGRFLKLIDRQRSIEKNNELMDDAMKTLGSVLKDLSAADASPVIAKYVAKTPDISDAATRLAVIDATLTLFREQLPEVLDKPDSELDSDVRPIGLAAKALRTIGGVNRDTLNVQTRDRRDLLSELQGKAIFINWAAAGGGDRFPTSLHPNCPGALIQSTLLNGILTRDLWRHASFFWTALFTAVVGIVTTILVALLPPWRALIFTLLVMLGYGLINGEMLFDYGNVIVGVAGPLLAGALVWGGLTLTNFITEARERARIRKRFSSYIDPAIVNFFEEHPELDSAAGQRREMTVAFTDLAGFTTISEKLGESSVNLLNEFFGKMVPVIRANNGVVNKFLGDGLMFFFNAPDDNPNHASDAVQTVLEMRKVLLAFNSVLKDRGLPPIGMRAGMTTGPMIVGDAGSKAEDEKNNSNDYTVLGDKVNLAARLEGANKVFGSNLMMNQETRDAIGNRFLCRKIGKIQVKGKSEYVMCHEAVCTMTEATADQTAHATLSSKIVDTFQAGEFDRCLALCDDLESQFKDADFAEAYRDECAKHLEKTFKGEFSGQIVLREK